MRDELKRDMDVEDYMDDDDFERMERRRLYSEVDSEE